MASEPAPITRDAALRQLLVDRVDAAAPRSRDMPRPGRAAADRPRLRTTLVTAFVSAAVVAVSVGALVLSDGPHPAPPGSGRHGAGPDTSESGAVTAAPTSAAPAPSAPATTTAPDPVTPPPSPDPTATPTATSELVVHNGWHDITRDQLHAYVVSTSWGQDDPANGAIWEEQAWLDKQCMATKGYLFDPISQSREIGTSTAGSGLTAEQLQGFMVAMYGPQTDAPYDWRTAGCHGLSVHETGQDNAH